MSGLRKALAGGRATIERSGDGYRLVGETLHIDAASFLRQASESRSALRGGDAARAAAGFAAA